MTVFNQVMALKEKLKDPIRLARHSTFWEKWVQGQEKVSINDIARWESFLHT